MKNLIEQIERINMISNYQVGVVISEQVEKSSNFETGKSYKYQFIDSKTKKPVTTPEVKIEKGTIPQTYEELPSTGMIKVKSIHSGGDVMAEFRVDFQMDLQYTQEDPTIFSHPDLRESNLLIKLYN